MSWQTKWIFLQLQSLERKLKYLTLGWSCPVRFWHAVILCNPGKSTALQPYVLGKRNNPRQGSSPSNSMQTRLHKVKLRVWMAAQCFPFPSLNTGHNHKVGPHNKHDPGSLSMLAWPQTSSSLTFFPVFCSYSTTNVRGLKCPSPSPVFHILFPLQD